MIKSLKKAMLLVLAVCAVCMISAAPKTYAAAVEKEYFTICGDVLYQWWYYDENLNEGSFRPREKMSGCVYTWMDGKVKIKSKSSKKSVMTVALDGVEEGLNDDGSAWASSTLKLKIKKPGVAKYTISATDPNTKKATKRVREVHVARYVNPVESLKIGAVDYASAFEKTPCKLVEGTLSGKLSVKAKAGWKIKLIRIEKNMMTGIYNTVKTLKNNRNVKIGDTQALEVVLYNKKLDQYAAVCVGAVASYAMIAG